ncbi:MAG: SRPBCC family protein [Actinomycetota bacterium]|nr:SRPBCC family protein [Actinomycetota bacterium]
MATIEASQHVPAPLAEAWDHFFYEPGWPAWVDGFASVIANAGYPQAGGTLRWRSTPAGRGIVDERVVEHEHRRRHLVSFADPTMEGELETRFAIEGDGTRIIQTFTYRVLAGGPVARIGAALFVKGQVRDSLARSLAGFRDFVEDWSAAA